MTIRSLPPAESANWLAVTFGLGEPVHLRPVSRGAMGEVCRLTTTTGTFAAKRYFWQESRLPRAEFSEAFAQRCRAAGVPIPEAVRDRSGALLARDGDGSWWQLAQWVLGTKPSADDVASARWLALQTARIHSVAMRPDWESRLDPFYAACVVDWTALIAVARTAGAAWADTLAHRAGDFAELATWANAAPQGELVISHNDLVLNNVVANGEQRWLIDWDNAGPQDPARELGVQLFDALRDARLVRDLVTTYRAAGGVEFHWGPEMFASAVVIRLNYLALQIELLLDPRQHGHHDFALAQVLPLLQRIPALPQLRERIEAVELGSGV